MPRRLHRTQLLLEEDQHRELAAIARSEGRSISEIVREVLQREPDRRRTDVEVTRQRQLAALERIRQHREAILAARGGKPIEVDWVEVINQMREANDQRFFDVDDARR